MADLVLGYGGGVDRITVPTADEETGTIRLRIGSQRRAPYADLGLTAAGAVELFEVLGDWIMNWSTQDAAPGTLVDRSPLASQEYAYQRVTDLLIQNPDMTAHEVLGTLMGEFQVSSRELGVQTKGEGADGAAG